MPVGGRGGSAGRSRSKGLERDTSIEHRVRQLETDYERQHKALCEDLSAKMQDAVRFLMKEVRRGKLRTASAHPADDTPPTSRGAPSKAAMAEEIASLRAEITQRSSELTALVEDKVAVAIDESSSKAKAEMEWFGDSIASRIDEQKCWFEEFRKSATQQLRDVEISRSAPPVVRHDLLQTDDHGQRLSKLEDRLELLEHDSVLMLIEELRNDVRKQLRAGKKERREESRRFQQRLEKVQDRLQQEADRTDSKLSALHIRVDEKISSSDSHMLRRTAELAAMIDELLDEPSTVSSKRAQEQQSAPQHEHESTPVEEPKLEPSGNMDDRDRRVQQLSQQVGLLSSELEKMRTEMQYQAQQPALQHEHESTPVEESKPDPSGNVNDRDRRVQQLSQQVGHLSSELEKMRTEMQHMRDAFRGLAPGNVSTIVDLAGSVQDEVRAMRAEMVALEAVTHEALRGQESEIVAQRRDTNSLADELREIATAIEHVARAQAETVQEKYGHPLLRQLSTQNGSGQPRHTGSTSTTSR